jgi:hypothetical protein
MATAPTADIARATTASPAYLGVLLGLFDPPDGDPITVGTAS